MKRCQYGTAMNSTLNPSVSIICYLPALLIAAGLALPALAQESFVYPAKGQSPEKMATDKAECQAWATQQTGFDPLRAATAPQTSSQQPPQKGGLLKGGAKGAAGGAAIGAIAGNAGKGAEIGAVSGGLMGGMKQRRQQQEQQRAAAQQAQAHDQAVNAFQRAYGACLKGRGYSIE